MTSNHFLPSSLFFMILLFRHTSGAFVVEGGGSVKDQDSIRHHGHEFAFTIIFVVRWHGSKLRLHYCRNAKLKNTNDDHRDSYSFILPHVMIVHYTLTLFSAKNHFEN